MRNKTNSLKETVYTYKTDVNGDGAGDKVEIKVNKKYFLLNIKEANGQKVQQVAFDLRTGKVIQKGFTGTVNINATGMAILEALFAISSFPKNRRESLSVDLQDLMMAEM